MGTLRPAPSTRRRPDLADHVTIASLCGINRAPVIDRLEAEGVSEDIAHLIATADEVTEQQWGDLTYDRVSEARAVIDAIHCTSGPEWRLRAALDTWTTELEAELADHADDFDATRALAEPLWRQ